MKDEKADRVADVLLGAERVVVLTGAGISAESGVPTFRGPDGLWRQYRAETLATPEAFERDPALVWQWYDWRRGLISGVEPNPGHRVLADWENMFQSFAVITQNVDGLHRKAGSKNVLELHGNIWMTRCTREATIRMNLESPLRTIPPVCPDCGALLRPHIVWFGESLDPEILDQAFRLCGTSQAMLVVGTSSVVQPAASLPFSAAEAGAVIIEINPEQTPLTAHADFFMQGKAGEILPLLDQALKSRGPAEDEGRARRSHQRKDRPR